MPAVNYLQAAIRIDRENSVVALRKFDDFMALTRIAVQPVSLTRTRLARLAYAEYGKGRHPAGLDFGDCFAYALAEETGLPFLFEGNDFSRTDMRPAVQAPSRGHSTRSRGEHRDDPGIAPGRPYVAPPAQGSGGTGNCGMSPVSACMKATRSSSSWPSSSTPSISWPMTTMASSRVATSPLLK